MSRPLISATKSLADLAAFIGVNTDLNLEFSGITSNSNSVEAGDLFAALPGAKVHGAEFVQLAKERGAVAILTDSEGQKIVEGSSIALPTIVIADPRRELGEICSWFYGSPTNSFKVAGITGTNGKTSTSVILYQLLTLAGKETGLIGTTGIQIGPEKLPAQFTTPEASELQNLFATMSERHITHAVMEVSSHALEARRVAGTKFAMVGFTNLTQDHLDFHGDMETYFAAKSRLFKLHYSELGFINIDDLYGSRLINSCEIPTISLSRMNRSAQWHYEKIEINPHGYSVGIRGTGGVLIEGELKLIGDHNLDNALMAVAMAFEFGLDPLELGDNLAKVIGAPGRLESIQIGQKFLALVDYAHTPDAVARTLETLRHFVDGRIIAILGCGGDRDISKRPIMGSELLAGSDLAIFTSDNPRSESAEAILSDMTRGLTLGENTAVIADRREAIAFAVANALPGDCIIALGKGHETGQEIAGIKYSFDDRIELARAIEELS